MLLCLPAAAGAVVESFDGPAAGMVIAGETPSGGKAPGTHFGGMTVTVANLGGGPASAIIFDSSAPSGRDSDLGTPNVAFGGPGIGRGGTAGADGENARSYGNLLIVAENIADHSPADGYVDVPNDEAGGGRIGFEFDGPVRPESIVLIDIDGETAYVDLFRAGEHIGVEDAADLGNNSVQTLDLSGHDVVTRIEVFFSSSGAVAEITYQLVTNSTESTSWGGVKAMFR